MDMFWQILFVILSFDSLTFVLNENIDRKPLTNTDLDIMKIVSAAQWKNIILVCEEHYVCPSDRLLSNANLNVVHFTLTNLANRSLLVQLLQTLVTRTIELNWLLFCSNCETIVQEINKYEEIHNLHGHLTCKYQWILVSHNARDMQKIEKNIGRIMHLAVILLKPNVELYTSMFGETRYFQGVDTNSLSKHQIFPNIANKMNNITLTVAMVPFMDMVNINDKGEYGGYYVHLMDMFSEALNFSYIVIEPPDGEYGTLKNGTWSGMVKQLVDRKADIAVHLTNNYERSLYTDIMNVAVQTDHYGVIYAKPKPTAMSLSIFMSPFHKYVWLSFCGILVLSIVTFHFSTKRQSSHFSQKLGFMNFISMSTLNQGSTWSPSSHSARIIYSCYSMGLIILMSTYTAFLVSVLAVQKPDIPFTTFKEVSENTDYKLGAIKGTAGTSFLLNQVSKDSSDMYSNLAKKLMKDIKQDPSVHFEDVEEILERFKSEKLAVWTSTTVFKEFASYSCDAALLDELGVGVSVGLLFQKDSAYTESFKKVMQMIREGSLDISLQNKYWNKPKQCMEKNTGPVALTNTYAVFYLLMIGVILAFVVLLIEITCNGCTIILNALWMVKVMKGYIM